MNRRSLLRFGLASGAFAAATARPARAQTPMPRGTGALGLIVERANGSLVLVDQIRRAALGRIEGLGDLSHASMVFSPCERYAFVFGRDGGLTKVDLLEARIEKRVVQGGNSIGGAISDDGTLIAVSNYEPGGVKVFDAGSLDKIASIPAIGANGAPSKTVGLVDLPGRRFIYSLYDADEIWIADFGEGATPKLTKFSNVGRLPYDGNVTSDARHYLAGLFGDDGFAHIDLWATEPKSQRVMQGYSAGREKLPVYKMPHLEGWGQSSDVLLLPAAGQHDVLALDLATLTEKKRIPAHGQPIFCVMRPDGREAWVNFGHPDNDTVQIIDIPSLEVVHSFTPGPAVLHLEFTPRGHEVWISVRDADRIDVMDVRRRTKIAEIPALKPSGIFFTARAHRLGS
ncbi:cytochrome D1 domain-containing protein [Rhodoblastus sp.]|uniref:cytochrome D1 domain-containing protein n=1 Tax=Rhodoblastus sp. TaxID=1962975 RepID=UPI0035B3786A